MKQLIESEKIADIIKIIEKDDDKEMYNNALQHATRHASDAATEIYFAQKVKNSATLDRIAQELKTIASELEDIAEA